MKIRIFALAKELGIDSKDLIEYASRAGVHVKNSALASISPAERDTVVRFMEQAGDQQTSAPPVADDEPLAPSRDADDGRSKKIRVIHKPTPSPADVAEDTADQAETAGTADDQDAGEPADEAVADDVAAEAEAEVADTGTPETETVSAEAAAPQEVPEESPAGEAAAEEVAAEATAEESTPAEQTTPTEQPAAAEAEAETEEEDAIEEAAIAEIPAETEQPAADDTPDQEATAESPAAEPTPAEAASAAKAPIRPDEYMPPGGSGRSSIRNMEMKPRGTVQSARKKKQNRPQLPAIAAAPDMPMPVKKKAPEREEAPAQKPEIRLTADSLAQSPLRDQLKNRRGRGDEQDDKTPKRGRTGAGSLREQLDQQRRDRRSGRTRRQIRADAVDARGRRPSRTKRRRGPIEFKTEAVVEEPMTVRSLSEAMGRPARDLLGALMKSGQMVTINEIISEEVALELALELGVDLEIKRGRDIEQELAERLDFEDPEDTLEPRPPVITILGHVDHGKTTMLDKIRSGNVAAGEAGGITQHIAAYQIDHNGDKLTFVDTPGHAAFSEMRARGAGVTDIVVLVVAADDGVMPQTVECIAHAKAAGVPIVVALNKIDRPDIDEQKVLSELASHDILPAEWGGEVEVVRTSGETGDGLDTLLETLLVTAELHELKVNHERAAQGVCLEAFQNEGLGAMAWIMVQKGTLRIGDIVLCGPAYGRIRAMYNDQHQEVSEAGPSTPVTVTGLDIVPSAGDHFFVMADIDEARETAEERRHRDRTEQLAGRNRPRTLEDILTAARGGEVQDLPLIIKADTPGSIEALRSEINKLEHPEVQVNIIHEGVGGVNESDVSLAGASGAIIIAFHVIAEDRAQSQAEHEGVDIRRFDIIYEVTDTIKRSLEGMLIPDRVQKSTGRALVLRTFSISRFGTIAGCRVLNGTIERNNRVHVIRDQTVLNDYSIASLKREKDDAREVREGMECGIRLDGFNDVKEGDLLEAFTIEEVKRTLD